MEQNYMAGRGDFRRPYPPYTREFGYVPPRRECHDHGHAHHKDPHHCHPPLVQPRVAEQRQDTEWPVGMAYVPWQTFGTPMEPCKGFQKGTIFPSLDYPFFAGGCCK